MQPGCRILIHIYTYPRSHEHHCPPNLGHNTPPPDQLNVMLHDMHFTFEDRIFHQSKASQCIWVFSTSGILAILFMDKLESALSHTASLAHTRDMQMTSTFTQPMNNLHPRLKSEIKRPTFSSEGLSLSLLALKATLSENSKKLLGKIQKKNNEEAAICVPSVSPTKKFKN